MEDLTFRNLGGVKSPLDNRDYKLNLVAGSFQLPDSCFIDISKLPHDNQRKIGACVGHAAEKAQQKNELQELGKIIPLSPRFIYSICKCLDGYMGEGTYPRLAAKVLKDFGCATEKTVPNDTTLEHEKYVYARQLDKIPQEAFKEAINYKIDGYAFSDITEEGIKLAIYYSSIKRQGTIMLTRVSNSYWTDINGVVTWDKNRILPLRAPSVAFPVISGHEVMPYGYDYVNGRLRIFIFNSWSDQWADGGNGWFYFDEWNTYIDEILTFLDKDDIPAKVFTKDLYYGMTDNQVKTLQQILNKSNFIIAQTGYGSIGKETTFFGSLTKQAVIRLQKAYSLPQTGFVGVLTRQVLNTLAK